MTRLKFQMAALTLWLTDCRQNVKSDCRSRCQILSHDLLLLRRYVGVGRTFRLQPNSSVHSASSAPRRGARSLVNLTLHSSPVLHSSPPPGRGWFARKYVFGSHQQRGARFSRRGLAAPPRQRRCGQRAPGHISRYCLAHANPSVSFSNRSAKMFASSPPVTLIPDASALCSQ